MPYIAAKCPKCGAHLSLDSNDEKGYCTYCGSIINFNDAVKNIDFDKAIESAQYKSNAVKYESTIYRILNEIAVYQKMIKNNIEKHYIKSYSVSRLWLLFASLPLIVTIVKTIVNAINVQDSVKALFLLMGPFFFGILYIICVISIYIAATGYCEIKRGTAIKIQKTLFLKKCSDILKPLGIMDLKYNKNIFYNNPIDLETKITDLINAQDKIINMNKSTFYEKPYIRYSIIDFLKGEKPPGYFDKE